MTHYQHHDYENRDTGQLTEQTEGPIDTLKRQIRELEAENEALRRKVSEGTPAEVWNPSNV